MDSFGFTLGERSSIESYFLIYFFDRSRPDLSTVDVAGTCHSFMPTAAQELRSDAGMTSAPKNLIASVILINKTIIATNNTYGDS